MWSSFWKVAKSAEQALQMRARASPKTQKSAPEGTLS